MDDIPEAIRETSPSKSSSKLPLVPIIGGVIGVGAIALLSSLFLSRPTPNPTANPQAERENTESTTPTETPTPQTENLENDEAIETSNTATPEDLLGHLPYEEVASSELTSISADGRLKLRHAAAEKFQQNYP